jgi:mRNA interferase RelE/StbE
MNYGIEMAPGVDKHLRRIEKATRLRLAGVIELLGMNPRPPGAKMLRGGERGLWRVRVGDYRVVYTIEDAKLIVLVIRIAHRSDVYSA